tara:strand:+ start:163 stop:393 length:231 start_codon:yes stop_codon:yes gene_type:complete
MNIKFFIDVPVNTGTEKLNQGDVQAITDDFVRLVEAWFANYNNVSGQHAFDTPRVSRSICDLPSFSQQELKLEFED